jgi:hypothetical protein
MSSTLSMALAFLQLVGDDRPRKYPSHCQRSTDEAVYTYNSDGMYPFLSSSTQSLKSRAISSRLGQAPSNGECVVIPLVPQLKIATHGLRLGMNGGNHPVVLVVHH